MGPLRNYYSLSSYANVFPTQGIINNLWLTMRISFPFLILRAPARILRVMFNASVWFHFIETSCILLTSSTVYWNTLSMVLDCVFILAHGIGKANPQFTQCSLHPRLLFGKEKHFSCAWFREHVRRHFFWGGGNKKCYFSPCDCLTTLSLPVSPLRVRNQNYMSGYTHSNS